MDHEIAVSVIVPIYKVQAYLQECIESILAQSLEKIEIILVDDGGTDECPSICDRYAAQDARVKVIHKPNGGLISARQAGLALAQGVYIGFVDGDDIIDRDFYKTLCKAACDENADVVCSGYTILEKDKKTPVLEPCVEHGVYPRAEIEAKIFPHLICENVTYGRMIDSVWSKIFRREVFCKYGIDMPEAIGTWEDFGFSKAAMMVSQKIIVLEYAGYYYRQVETSMSHSYIKGHREQILQAYRFLLRVAKQENAPETILEQLERYRRYYAGEYALLRECSPQSPNNFKAICNLCRKIYDYENVLLICESKSRAENLFGTIYRMRNPLLTATMIFLMRIERKVKRLIEKHRSNHST